MLIDERHGSLKGTNKSSLIRPFQGRFDHLTKRRVLPDAIEFVAFSVKMGFFRQLLRKSSPPKLMYIVFTTVSSQETGENLAEKIISNKLAACVQILPKMTSVYVWEGELKKEPEHLLLIKTLDSTYKELQEFLIENHDSDVPEIIAMESEKVSEDYFAWMSKSIS